MREQRRLQGCPPFPRLLLLLLALLVAGRTTSAGEEEGIGTRHRIKVDAASPDGCWVLIRQARVDTDGDGSIRVGFGHHGEFVGDEMKRYLVIGGGPGEAIDLFAGSDPSGRYVAVIQDGSLVLIDMETDKREDLSRRGADARSDGLDWRPHRATSFDGLGRRMTYMRPQGQRWVVVVRDLGLEAREYVVDPGEGLLYRARLTPDGEHVRVEVVARDTDGDGRCTWPYPEPPKPPPYGGLFSRRRILGDDVEVRFAPATGGRAQAVPGRICPLPPASVVRGGDWSLRLQHADGTKTLLVEGRHAALVLAVNPVLRALVVVHTTGPNKGDTFWIREGQRRKLSLRQASFGLEDPQVHAERWAPLRKRGPVVLDYETGVSHSLEGRVIALHGHIVLLERDRQAVLHDLVDGREVSTPAVCRHALYLRQAGPMCAIDGRVYDLERMAFVGSYRGHPLVVPHEGHARAVTTDGRVLLVMHEAPEPVRGGAHPAGPLRWIKPTP